MGEQEGRGAVPLLQGSAAPGSLVYKLAVMSVIFETSVHYTHLPVARHPRLLQGRLRRQLLRVLWHGSRLLGHSLQVVSHWGVASCRGVAVAPPCIAAPHPCSRQARQIHHIIRGQPALWWSPAAHCWPCPRCLARRQGGAARLLGRRRPGDAWPLILTV